MDIDGWTRVLLETETNVYKQVIYTAHGNSTYNLTNHYQYNAHNNTK